MSKAYTIHAGDEFGGDELYSLLCGPDGFQCWLTEPEDRNWGRDGAEVVKKLNEYHALIEKQQREINGWEESLRQRERCIDELKAELEQCQQERDGACNVVQGANHLLLKAGEREARLMEAVNGFMACMNQHGEWEDSCFYYNGHSATELKRPIEQAIQLLNKEQS